MPRPSPNLHPSRIAETLGYIALVPFVVGAALTWLLDVGLRDEAARALSVYAAVVASFIGGIHWGLGFRQEQPAARLFVWGVVPSILAWIAVLVRLPTGLVMQALILAICYLVDRRVYPIQGVARWLPLRLRLTIIAVASCVVGAAGS